MAADPTPPAAAAPDPEPDPDQERLAMLREPAQWACGPPA
jgi:hypothetical protein